MIHPLVLGSGWRLFGDGTPSARLRLADTEPEPGHRTIGG